MPLLIKLLIISFSFMRRTSRRKPRRIPVDPIYQMTERQLRSFVPCMLQNGFIDLPPPPPPPPPAPSYHFGQIPFGDAGPINAWPLQITGIHCIQALSSTATLLSIGFVFNRNTSSSQQFQCSVTNTSTGQSQVLFSFSLSTIGQCYLCLSTIPLPDSTAIISCSVNYIQGPGGLSSDEPELPPLPCHFQDMVFSLTSSTLPVQIAVSQLVLFYVDIGAS
jgi:hypothetical protein